VFLDYIVWLCGQKTIVAIAWLVYFHLTIQPIQSNVTFISSNVRLMSSYCRCSLPW